MSRHHWVILHSKYHLSFIRFDLFENRRNCRSKQTIANERHRLNYIFEIEIEIALNPMLTVLDCQNHADSMYVHISVCVCEAKTVASKHCTHIAKYSSIDLSVTMCRIVIGCVNNSWSVCVGVWHFGHTAIQWNLFS